MFAHFFFLFRVTSISQFMNIEPNTYVAITTESQTNGRGTNNRTWIGRKGNTFLTLAIPSNDLKIPLTLLPLQIGLILVEQVHSMLINTKEAVVNVKWPNDVLVNEKKIAGVLIESEQDYDGNYYFLVGIGVNYRFAPMVDASGAQRGREATCIYDCVSSVKDNNDNDIDNDDNDGVEEAKALGIKIANDIKAWMELQKSWDGAADSIVTRWENWADFGTKLTLRDEPGNEIVIPLGLEKDGRLRVKGQNGKERLLCFDYLL
jgi:BirA family biotin operon repressor/biotin-[acetyl-CoA-carboxylase] ligase